MHRVVYACTEEEFLKNVEDHRLTIVKDDGAYRHLRFQRKGSSVYHFDIVTWPGCLCITGDCETYVFRRVEDMFAFFRGDKINPGYWSEKLQGIDRSGRYREFSEHLFREAVENDFAQWDFESDAYRDEVWEDVCAEVLDYEHKQEAYENVNNYTSRDGQRFDDFFEHILEEYTFHFIWCLWAIVWGIRKYDEAKERDMALFHQMRGALKEIDEYLSSNKLNSVGSGSILHRNVREVLGR